MDKWLLYCKLCCWVFFAVNGIEAFPVAREDETDAAFTCCQKCAQHSQSVGVLFTSMGGGLFVNATVSRPPTPREGSRVQGVSLRSEDVPLEPGRFRELNIAVLDFYFGGYLE